MAKADTISALMEAAIEAFSKYGFEGASLRDIANQAKVPLGTIHLYFGSKADLFLAVERQVWSEIDADRTALLNKALARGVPELEDLVYALAEPVIRRALGYSEPNLARIQLMRCTTSARRLWLKANFQEVADRSVSRWIDAMEQICQPMSRDDVIWAFSFVVGAIYSWQLVDRRYEGILSETDHRSAESTTQDVVAFCCAGVRAMMARRANESLSSNVSRRAGVPAAVEA